MVYSVVVHEITALPCVVWTLSLQRLPWHALGCCLLAVESDLVTVGKGKSKFVGLSHLFPLKGPKAAYVLKRQHLKLPTVSIQIFKKDQTNTMLQNLTRASVKRTSNPALASRSSICCPEQGKSDRELSPHPLYEACSVIPYSWARCSAYLSMKYALGTNQGENRRK